MSQFDSFQDTGKGLNLRIIIGVIAAAALALFILQNTQDTKVNFLWMDGTIPLYLLLIITGILFVVVAGMVVWLIRRRNAD